MLSEESNTNKRNQRKELRREENVKQREMESEGWKIR